MNVTGEKEQDPDPFVRGTGRIRIIGCHGLKHCDQEHCQFEVPYINTIILSTGTVQHNTLALYHLLLTKSAVIFSLLCRLLLAHGADVNAQSSSGNTPLMYACAGGHEDVSTVYHLTRLVRDASSIILKNVIAQLSLLPPSPPPSEFRTNENNSISAMDALRN